MNKDVQEAIDKLTDWNLSEKMQWLQDAMIPSVWLIANTTREQAIILYLEEDDFEEVDYQEALVKYFRAKRL